MRRSILLGSCVVLFSSPAAEAKLWPTWELESLAFQSDLIVLVKQVDAKNLAGPGQFPTMRRSVRIEKVYQGRAVVGQTISFDDHYPRSSNSPFAPKPPPQFEDRMLVCLKRTTWFSGPAPAGTGPVTEQQRWNVVHSGLRLFAGGKIYRYVQFDNPGPIVPSLLRETDSKTGTARDVEFRELERNFREAIVRAETLRALFAGKIPESTQEEAVESIRAVLTEHGIEPESSKETPRFLLNNAGPFFGRAYEWFRPSRKRA